MEGTMDVSLVDAVTDKLCKAHPGATSTAEDGEGGAPCTIAPMHPPGSQLDIFRVGTILRAAGLDLDGASFGNEHRWVISAWATNEVLALRDARAACTNTSSSCVLVIERPAFLW